MFAVLARELSVIEDTLFRCMVVSLSAFLLTASSLCCALQSVSTFIYYLFVYLFIYFYLFSTKS